MATKATLTLATALRAAALALQQAKEATGELLDRLDDQGGDDNPDRDHDIRGIAWTTGVVADLMENWNPPTPEEVRAAALAEPPAATAGPEPEEDEDVRRLNERSAAALAAEPPSARALLVLVNATRRLVDAVAAEVASSNRREFYLDPRDNAAWDYNLESIVNVLEGELVGAPEREDHVEEVLAHVRTLLANATEGGGAEGGVEEPAVEPAPDLAPRSLGNGSGNPFYRR
jgi:hypothetical protein